MENGQEAFAAPIVDLVQQFMVPSRDLCWPHDIDICGILNAPADVTRRFVQIDDNSVAGMLRVQLAVSCPHQAYVGTYGAKGYPVSKWFDTINLQSSEHALSLSEAFYPVPVVLGPHVTPKSARSTTCPVKLAAVCCANQTAAGMIEAGCVIGMWAVPGQSPRRFIQVSTRPGLNTLTAILYGRTSSARLKNMRSRAALL